MDGKIVNAAKEMTTKRNKKKDLDEDVEYLRNTLILDPEGNCDCDSSDSVETASDEIPVWIHGEQRWISGVSDDTTCSDLVNVLLADENTEDVNGEGAEGQNTGITNKRYVITERWRRVEQILHDDTKILQIWSAWGHAKSEVKLTLRPIDISTIDWSNNSSTFDRDSGMGSPNGSTISAIIRRRRHRASKSTTAWMTQAQTIHPKSQKATIERLMKLILEQGETIQQQLAKLRDRELQIAKIEEERHKVREKEHGKNYLLETYLNGLHEAEDKEVVAVNSDSGVQTEGALSSPEVGSCIQEDEDYQITDITKTCIPYKEKPSHRERKLLKEHKHTKEFSSMLHENAASSSSSTATSSSNSILQPSLEQVKQQLENDLTAKIEWMEKLVVINKHLQREEELLVRLGAKIRKYESENPQLNETQIRDALIKVNVTIDGTTKELKKIEDDLIVSNEQLNTKTNLLDTLNKELFAIEQKENSNYSQSSSTTTIENCKKFDLNENMVESLYNYQQYISKPNYDFNEINENRDQKSTYLRHTPDLLKTQLFSSKTSTLLNTTNLPNYSDSDHMNLHYPEIVSPISQKIAQAPILKCRNQNPFNCYSTNNGTDQMDLVASMNLLHKPDQIQCGMNIYETKPLENSKLGPKKFINGASNEFESNSDTGLSSIGEDITQLGTLV